MILSMLIPLTGKIFEVDKYFKNPTFGKLSLEIMIEISKIRQRYLRTHYIPGFRVRRMCRIK